MNIRGRLYRFIMKIAHKYHWHYAPPIYPGGDRQLWCKWCGFRGNFPIAVDYWLPSNSIRMGDATLTNIKED